MRFSLFGIIATFCFSVPSLAQTSDEEQVSQVITRLFKGMELGDSAMVHSTFYKGVNTATIFRDKNNVPVIRQESSIQAFLNQVGKPHPEVWYEEIWNVQVKVDGDLAQAWCDYAFYVDNNFSHCGVDAFQLFRTKQGWQIFQLSDTRRKMNCDVPAEVQNKHK